MWTPVWNIVVERLALRIDVVQLPVLAGSHQRGFDHLIIGLPRSENLVPPVGGKVHDKAVQIRSLQTSSKHPARDLADLEKCKRAVAIEGDELGSELGHSLWACLSCMYLNSTAEVSECAKPVAAHDGGYGVFVITPIEQSLG